MIKSESYASEIWLISGFINSLPGLLSLDKGRLTFTAIGGGTYWDSGLKKLENKCGNKEFCALLKRGKPAILFSVDLKDIQKVTYPFIYFSGGAHLFFDNKKYRLSFIQPNNSVMPEIDRSRYERVVKRTVEIIEDISHARRVGKKWRSLLPQ
jgi:hypothetical protein